MELPISQRITKLMLFLPVIFLDSTGMEHLLRIGHSATVLRSLYFYAHDDSTDPFYTKLGIYPASELLIQMIKYTEIWDENM